MTSADVCLWGARQTSTCRAGLKSEDLEEPESPTEPRPSRTCSTRRTVKCKVHEQLLQRLEEHLKQEWPSSGAQTSCSLTRQLHLRKLCLCCNQITSVRAIICKWSSLHLTEVLGRTYSRVRTGPEHISWSSPSGTELNSDVWFQHKCLTLHPLLSWM